MITFFMALLSAGSLKADLVLQANLSEYEIYEMVPCVIFESGAMAVAGEQEIVLLGEDGRLLKRLGRKGQGPGEFQRISNLIFDQSKNQLVAIDNMNRRFSVWSEAGELVSDRQFPTGLAFDFRMLDGSVYGLIDLAGHFDGNPRLVRYGDGGETELWGKKLSGPLPVTASTFPDGGEIAILLEWDPRIVYAVCRDFAAVTWAADNKIYLVDLQTHKVINSFVCKLPRYELTDEDVNRQVMKFDPSYRDILAPKVIRSEFWPSTSSIFIDPKQRIWVFSYRRSETEPVAVRVFDKEGVELGRGELSEVPSHIDGQTILMTVMLDDEVWLQKRHFQL